MAHKELVNSIVNAITAQIYRGKSYVTESELAETLKVSRIRLRESIQVLHVYGVISKRQKCGITLARPDVQSLCEACILRETLEKLSTGSVLKHVTDTDCVKLEDIDRRLQCARSERDYPAFLRYDLEFHHALTEIGEMKIASQILRNIHFLNYAYLAPLVTKLGDDSASLPDHREIIGSLRRRDPAYRKLIRRHAQHSRKLLMKYYSPRGDGSINKEVIL